MFQPHNPFSLRPDNTALAISELETLAAEYSRLAAEASSMATTVVFQRAATIAEDRASALRKRL